MIKTHDFPVSKKEEDGNLAKRREDYALKRDLQAQYNNAIISKRVIPNESGEVICEKCGVEFKASLDAHGTSVCPECANKK